MLSSDEATPTPQAGRLAPRAMVRADWTPALRRRARRVPLAAVDGRHGVRLPAFWRKLVGLDRRIGIIGSTEQAGRLIRWLTAGGHDRGQIVLYDDRGARTPDALEHVPVRGDVDRLLADARQQRFDDLILALPVDDGDRVTDILARLEPLPASVFLAPDTATADGAAVAATNGAAVATVNGVELAPHGELVQVAEQPLRGRARLIKLVEDKVIATAALILLAPLLALVAAAIKLDSPGPVLFRQRRFGFEGQEFDVFKFRTMYDGAAPSDDGQTQHNDRRITRVGRWLRRSSIDELPQLINVFRGDMSVVGPRPHSVDMKIGDVHYHDAVPGYAARHRVKPGVTGWAQVNGSRGPVRDLDLGERRVRFDLHYIDNWSLGFDLRIIWRTFWRLPFDEKAW